MTKEVHYSDLKAFCLNLGIEAFGVADISSIRRKLMFGEGTLAKVDKAISLGVGLSSAVLEDIEQAPTRLYFHHYKTANMFLDQCAFKVSSFLQQKGFRAIPIPASVIVDWQNQKGHCSHKEIALLAGLGWIGRNNLLVHPVFGSRLRLATILTDIPVDTDKPQSADCAECFACVAACPAAAIKPNPQEFDHLRCFEQLKAFQKQRLVDQYICGVCVNACRGPKKD
ncbi:MAG: hypothetical protein KBA46_07075 [Candidatus Omnitrophica bacterium]|nr:hypothetical protein [Candidatus Omnitrophota bacterium]